MEVPAQWKTEWVSSEFVSSYFIWAVISKWKKNVGKFETFTRKKKEFLLQNFVLLELLISKCYEDAKNKTTILWNIVVQKTVLAFHSFFFKGKKKAT